MSVSQRKCSLRRGHPAGPPYNRCCRRPPVAGLGRSREGESAPRAMKGGALGDRRRASACSPTASTAASRSCAGRRSARPPWARGTIALEVAVGKTRQGGPSLLADDNGLDVPGGQISPAMTLGRREKALHGVGQIGDCELIQWPLPDSHEECDRDAALAVRSTGLPDSVGLMVSRADPAASVWRRRRCCEPGGAVKPRPRRRPPLFLRGSRVERTLGTTAAMLADGDRVIAIAPCQGETAGSDDSPWR